MKDCQDAGMKVHMATGDHPTTAEGISKLINILPDNKIDRILNAQSGGLGEVKCLEGFHGHVVENTISF